MSQNESLENTPLFILLMDEKENHSLFSTLYRVKYFNLFFYFLEEVLDISTRPFRVSMPNLLGNALTAMKKVLSPFPSLYLQNSVI